MSHWSKACRSAQARVEWHRMEQIKSEKSLPARRRADLSGWRGAWTQGHSTTVLFPPPCGITRELFHSWAASQWAVLHWRQFLSSPQPKLGIPVYIEIWRSHAAFSQSGLSNPSLYYIVIHLNVITWCPFLGVQRVLHSALKEFAVYMSGNLIQKWGEDQNPTNCHAIQLPHSAHVVPSW